MAHVPEQRQDDRQHDAFLDADGHHHRGGGDGKEEFARTFAADVAQAGDVDHPDRDREHDGGQHAARQVLQRAGQGQQHQQHDAREHQLRDLAARAGAIRHGGLRRAAVDHEGPAHGGGGIRGRQPEDVGVLVDPLAVTQREDARGRGALRDDHHEARRGDRQHIQGFPPAHLGQRDRRQPAGDRTDDRDAALGEVECGAGRDRAHHRDQRHGKARRDTMAEEDAARHERGQQRGRNAEPRQPPADLPGLDGRAVRRRRDAEHVAEHRHADLNADAGEKPDQDRTGEEIGEEIRV